MSAVHPLPHPALDPGDLALRDAASARLERLRAELHDGERAIAELDQRRDQLTTTMLRISGAAQVLEELLKDPAGGDAAY